MKTFLHEVSAGDIIFSLASVQHLGGGHYYLKGANPQPYHTLRRFVESQPYISGFTRHLHQKIDHDFSTFRKGGIPFGVQLAKLHSNWIDVPVDFSIPWLTVDSSEETKGKIVVARTSRYNNNYFPWKSLAEAYHKDMVFVGLETEWKQFCSRVGKYIPHLRTNDLYDVGRAIAGCEVFIGNQSSPNAICEGLKHTLIQETSLQVPDCIFPRSNAIHCYDGYFRAEILGKVFESEMKPSKVRFPMNETPSGGWKVKLNGKEFSSYDIAVLANQVGAAIGEVPANIREMAYEYTINGLALEAMPMGVHRQMEAVKRLCSNLNENRLRLESVVTA